MQAKSVNETFSRYAEKPNRFFAAPLGPLPVALRSKSDHLIAFIDYLAGSALKLTHSLPSRQTHPQGRLRAVVAAGQGKPAASVHSTLSSNKPRRTVCHQQPTTSFSAMVASFPRADSGGVRGYVDVGLGDRRDVFVPGSVLQARRHAATRGGGLLPPLLRWLL
jgi:hypothetical protein